MDIGADVAFVSQQGRSGVQTDAHPDRTALEALGDSASRRQRTGRRRERDEEGVALRIDLDPALGAESLPQDAAMLGERRCVRSRAQLVQELGRALHVCEQEGDRPGRQIATHGLHDRAHAARTSLLSHVSNRQK